MESNVKKQIRSRWARLKQERSSWDSHWKEISEYLLPRSGKFCVEKTNQGDKRHNNIYDSTGTKNLRILAAGMMSGMTSPAKPWFKLGVPDYELMKYSPVKVWLNDVTRLMLQIFHKSNTYRSLHSMYEEMGAFGTAAGIIAHDFDSVIHHYPLTVGEYCIATNWKGEVVTLYREFQKTVSELVGEFGIEQVSDSTRRLFDSGHLDEWVTIIHAIEPRDDRDYSKLDQLNMPWRSVYFEQNSNHDEVLRESGFKKFPVLAPRWAVAGGDIYGNSPGMDALGDLKQLQHEQLRKAQGIDYQTKPPMMAPSSMKNKQMNMLPGGVTYVDMVNGNVPVRPAFDSRIDLSHLLMDIQDVRGRIASGFFADMFLMLANSTNPQMTATEVAERHEEKLLMIGPVTERIKNELLDPLIEITFDAIIESGILPPPPPELEGQDLNIELVGILAQAQRAVGVNSIDRFVSSIGGLAQIKGDVLDKFDSDKWVDIYADSLGVDPELIVPDEVVAGMRQQRAQQAQAAQEAAMMQQGADVAQTLSNTKTDDANALTGIMQMMGG
ncbi:MAG: portal protein [Saezia sp.]